MEKTEFYQKFANTPITKRYIILSLDNTSPIFGMTLLQIYNELNFIDNKLREDEIRRKKLLEAVESFIS